MTTMTTAVLGTGTVARTLARALADAGRPLALGSRHPERAAAAWPEAPVRPTTLERAAEAGGIVVNALPGPVSLDVLGALAPQLTGKVLVDVANATASDDRGFASALLHPDSSLAEELQRALPHTHVVKTLNTVHVSLMADPGAIAAAPTAFLSGDDADAKAAVLALLTDLGWPDDQVVDLGGIATARVPEAFILLVGPLVGALGPVPFALSVAR